MLAVFLWIKYSKVMKSDLIVLIYSYVPHKQCTPGAGPSSSMKSGMVQMTHLCRSEAGGLFNTTLERCTDITDDVQAAPPHSCLSFSHFHQGASGNSFSVYGHLVRSIRCFSCISTV